MNSESCPSKTGTLAPESQSSGAHDRAIRIADNRIDSRELFAATREITIAHGADLYRLRLTAQNKLILTK
jgi:hemin uptake protein HemP